MPKRLLFAALLFFISLDFLSSCKTDFDVNAPYKEEYVVYGLLELNLPTQVIKISKVFQNNSSVTANQAAQTLDSTNTPDNLSVQLIEMQNGAQVSATKLTKYYDTHKQTGVFAAPGQYLYQTPTGFTLNASSTYKLTIDNPTTKFHSEASTPIVGDIVAQRPTQTSEINFTDVPNTYYPITYAVGTNAFTYDVDIYIPINEYDKKTSTLQRSDTLVMNIFTNYSQVQGGKVIYNILGTDFYNFIGSSLKVDTSLYRTMDALDFTFAGAGVDLTNYIQVNTPSLGIVQKQPDYTNISNGIGVFSSRITDHVVTKLSDDAYNFLLTSDATKALNFRK